MQSALPEIEKHGATLVALTPQKPERSQTMVERHELGFDLLSDPGNAYAAELGLRFELPDYLKTVYRDTLKLDLPAHNGDDSWTLPIPARLVIDREGTVRAADIDVDYTRRPEPEKTLRDLAAL